MILEIDNKSFMRGGKFNTIFYFLQTCFVQMRKKEPPHPIRVAKTIDVIARYKLTFDAIVKVFFVYSTLIKNSFPLYRITFPLAYAVFLIIFFAHKKFFAND